MKSFNAWGVAKLLGHMDKAKADIAKVAGMGNGGDTMEKEAIELYIEPNVFHALAIATPLMLQSTLDRVWDGGGPFWMAMKTGQLTYQQAEFELVVLRQCIEADLEKLLFAYIEPRRTELFAGLGKHWQEILDKVPESKTDVEDAHIAYMVELHTATVFHLMRVAEHGLRIIAKKLRVSTRLKHRGQIIPIDHAEWQKVIDAINGKLNTMKALPSGPKRTAQLERFSDAAQHCLFMKDIWRNTVSHTRKPYNEPEAKAALERVHGFMQFVATEFPKQTDDK